MGSWDGDGWDKVGLVGAQNFSLYFFPPSPFPLVGGGANCQGGLRAGGGGRERDVDGREGQEGHCRCAHSLRAYSYYY